MWTRDQLKSSAKAVLRQGYWKAFLVSLLSALLLGGASRSGNAAPPMKFSVVPPAAVQWQNAMHSLEVCDWWEGLLLLLPLFAIFLGISLFAGLIGAAVSFLLSNPLQVGCARYFLESTQFRFSLEEVFHGFSGGNYWNVVKTMFRRWLYILLWSLLLVIPGIIKAYSYYLVPYLLAENPNLSPDHAMDLSTRMMRGHRFDTFVLGLSFLGWYFLGSLCFGIGVFFVRPYEETTQAELYVALRAIALDAGIISLEELRAPY